MDSVWLEQQLVSFVAASPSLGESEKGVRCYGGAQHYTQSWG